MRPHFKIGFLISNFEKAFVVISIAIKIMISIVLNQDILYPWHHQMVKSVQQMATHKSLVSHVLVILESIAVVYVKNIVKNVISNVVIMTRVTLIQIQINVQSLQMNQHLTPMTQHVPLQLKLDVTTLLIILEMNGMHVKLISMQPTILKMLANLKLVFGLVMLMKQKWFLKVMVVHIVGLTSLTLIWQFKPLVATYDAV